MKYQVTYHKTDTALSDPAIAQRLAELLAVIEDWVVPSYKGKSSKQEDIDLVHPILNAIAEYWLTTLDWKTQGVLAELTGGKETERGTVDFYAKMADGRYVLVEVQFGNGARLERDFSKLQKLHRHGLLALGVLIYFDRATGKTADSGLATYETTVARKAELGEVPTAIVGVSRQDSDVVDLRALKDIVFPTVLGGSGEKTGSLHAFIAKALIERTPLETLVLPEELLSIVRAHHQEHMRKSMAAFRRDVQRAATCTDPKLQQFLFEMLSELAKSSYQPAQSKLARKATQRKESSLRQSAPGATVASEAAVLATAAVVEKPKWIRVPRGKAAVADRASPVPGTLVPPAEVRYPTSHFALAGALQRALNAPLCS